MTALTQTRIELSTGVTLNVQLGGARGGEAIVFLHGFPESHRTWREIAPALAEDYFVVVPDQRGFGASDKPLGVENYRADRIVEDLLALADQLELERFTLVGHDWGGAVAWFAALRHPDRLKRLVIVNAPHPLVFQKSLIEDAAQRAASQYITAFRNPGMEQGLAAMGLETFYAKTFASHADIALAAGSAMPVDPEADERALYLAEGEASLDGLRLEPCTLYVLRPGIAATLRSATGGHVMLLGGAPLDGPRHVFWNFVSSRRDRINQAKEDWKAGRFALPPDDHDEFIPLPEIPLTVSYP